MAVPPEPSRDHRTINSYKRTFNAAVLIWIARPRPLTRASRTRTIVVTGVAILAGWQAFGAHFLSLL